MKPLKIDFDSLADNIVKHKESYQIMYNKRLKFLFQNKPKENFDLLISKLRIYKKILHELDSKMNCTHELIEDNDDMGSEVKAFISGQKSAYLEMRQSIDKKLCKLRNMMDCIIENNPGLEEVIEEEIISAN